MKIIKHPTELRNNSIICDVTKLQMWEQLT